VIESTREDDRRFRHRRSVAIDVFKQCVNSYRATAGGMNDFDVRCDRTARNGSASIDTWLIPCCDVVIYGLHMQTLGNVKGATDWPI
jgi:hypothetical protein